MQFHRILPQIKQLLRPVMEIPDILNIAGIIEENQQINAIEIEI